MKIVQTELFLTREESMIFLIRAFSQVAGRKGSNWAPVSNGTNPPHGQHWCFHSEDETSQESMLLTFTLEGGGGLV